MVIVIADDEGLIAELVAEVAREAGHTTIVVADGRAALEAMRRERPALLITDLMMPRMTGAELIEELRAHAAAHGYAPVPIIVMTAARAQQAAAVGADAVLYKPFDLDALDALLTRFLGTGSA